MSVWLSGNEQTDEVVIHIKGRLDRNELDNFRDVYKSIGEHERDKPRVVVDLEQATFIDRAGLQELVGMKDFLGYANGEISIVRAPVTIRTLLSNIRYDRQFVITS